MIRRPSFLSAWALLPALLLPGAGIAQEEASAVLDGQVLKGDVPLDSGTVTLHEVGPDSAGELESTSVSPEGRFSFRLPSVPDPATGHQVYFASIRYRDILYFGPAIAEAVQLDTLYVIQVYDTTAAPAGGQELPVAVRNVFLESSGDGWQVTDLFQVRNGTERTYVASRGPVWVYPLPPEAANLTVGQSDLAPDAVELDGHILKVSAPLPPGERLYMVRYTLPELETSFPTPGVTERMELLVREPAPPLTVDPLQPTQPVELEQGSSYRRYAGRSLSGGRVVITVSEESSGIPVRWVAVALALVLSVAGILAMRRVGGTDTPEPAAPGPGPGGARQAVLLEIARLDEAFSREDDPDPARTREYRRRREALKEKLRALDSDG